MTKKQLITKLEDYKYELDAMTKAEDKLREQIKYLEREVEALNKVNNDLRDHNKNYYMKLQDRLEFEQLLLEVFTKIINDYQGN